MNFLLPLFPVHRLIILSSLHLIVPSATFTFNAFERNPHQTIIFPNWFPMNTEQVKSQKKVVLSKHL